MERDLKQKLLTKSQENEEEEEPLGKRVWNETKLMWIVAAPAIFTRFSTFGIQVISQAFVGHIGSRELAAFALVFTVLIRFANGILVIFILHYFFFFILYHYFFSIIEPFSMSLCYLICMFTSLFVYTQLIRKNM